MGKRVTILHYKNQIEYLDKMIEKYSLQRQELVDKVAAIESGD